MIIVDTTVWVDFFNGVPTPQVRLLYKLLETEKLLIGDLVLCELLQGVRNDTHARIIQNTLSAFSFDSMVGPDIAVKAAANYRRLRELGVTIRKTIDLLIGTFCIEHGHTLLHADRDFDFMARHLGLQTL